MDNLDKQDWQNSPGLYLCSAVPFLHRLHASYTQALEGSNGGIINTWSLRFPPTLHRPEPLGASVSGDHELEAAANDIRLAIIDFVRDWNAGSNGSDGCPPLAWFAGLADMRLPLEDWIEGGQASTAFMAAMVRASIGVDSPVAMLGMDGWPRELGRIKGGNPTDGFVLEDGGRLEFRGGHNPRWYCSRHGRRPILEVRLAQPHDGQVIAMRAGKLDADLNTIEVDAMPADPDHFVARSVVVPRDMRLCSQEFYLGLDTMLEDILPQGTHGDLLAYMLRRFGPATGSLYNEDAMCGQWMLSTQLDDLYLQVNPSINGLELSMRAMLTPATASTLARLGSVATMDGAEDMRAWLSTSSTYTRALRTVLSDLLRPVFVRDVAMNALGRVDDDSLAGDSVPSSPASTVGIPPTFLDDYEAFMGLQRALASLGKDSMGEAMRTMAVLVAEHVSGRNAEAGPAAPGIG